MEIYNKFLQMKEAQKPLLTVDAIINKYRSLSPQKVQQYQVYAVAAGAPVNSSGANCQYSNHYLLDHNHVTHQGWLARSAVVGSWIQVSQEFPKLWTGVVMQGRGDAAQWVTAMRVLYTVNGKIWQQVDGGKTFNANTDQNTKVKISFETPVYARALRIYPQTWNGHISMRFDAIYMDFS